MTRKKRIDPKLDDSGWKLGLAGVSTGAWRTEEEPTALGPADYALWSGGKVVGVVEAKKLSVGPQNVLTQAERYARSFDPAVCLGVFGEYRCPFLYATNGEVIWFRDVRHPLERSRTVARFHTPSALTEMLGRDHDAACAKLLALPHDHPKLRPYQKDANAAVDKAIADRKRNLLVAMATGTGKTFTLVNQIYRLMKSGVARRVLFLVDRRALAAQAVRAFSSFEVEPGKKFDQVYEVYSSKFQTEDFSDEDKFDPKVLPQKYLTDPQPAHAFVYVATIQRMAMNVLGRSAVFGGGDEGPEADATALDIPIHAFDVIVADECHRGYTSQEISTWRATLNHFDAIKVGLTATPASHTTAYFTHKVFEYGYEQAVRDGHLVDYDVVTVRSEVRMEGVFLREGENVEVVDPETGLSTLDTLEDERAYDTGAIEQEVSAPDSNQKILAEVKRHADAHERAYGRFPKTLIFAVNDIPHLSHADQLVTLARDVFGRGEDFVEKITGRVDRPLHRIREFRNRPSPAIAVTVDLLSTGVDIPDLEFIVFLRPVKSRILFEQMLGRGTRKGEHHTDKDHFTVFDCFDGTLLQYFKASTGITKEEPSPPSRSLRELVADIWANKNRKGNINAFVKRLQRIAKAMASDRAEDHFAGYVPQGDLATFASGLPARLDSDFVATMSVLRDERFLHLLETYPRPERYFVRAYETVDTVSSTFVLRDAGGAGYKPADYLQEFSRFVAENPDHIDAVTILLDRPQAWSPEALSELREKLKQSRHRFTIDQLQRAHEAIYRKALVDVISMVKRAVDAEAPLLTAAERVDRAFAKVTAGRTFTPDQQRWLDRIHAHLRENLSIERDDFELVPVLSDAGGLGAARRVFGDAALDDLLHDFNEAIAA
ncbi:MAG: type I restriction-modification enzyme R subunit C-terminal domain-containing protein [Polyangiales bacterium]